MILTFTRLFNIQSVRNTLSGYILRLVFCLLALAGGESAMAQLTIKVDGKEYRSNVSVNDENIQIVVDKDPKIDLKKAGAVYTISGELKPSGNVIKTYSKQYIRIPVSCTVRLADGLNINVKKGSKIGVIDVQAGTTVDFELLGNVTINNYDGGYGMRVMSSNVKPTTISFRSIGTCSISAKDGTEAVLMKANSQLLIEDKNTTLNLYGGKKSSALKFEGKETVLVCNGTLNCNGINGECGAGIEVGDNLTIKGSGTINAYGGHGNDTGIGDVTYPGILVEKGKTLDISLFCNGNINAIGCAYKYLTYESGAAGIGGKGHAITKNTFPVGEIKINGGSITSVGGFRATGIGTGHYNQSVEKIQLLGGVISCDAKSREKADSNTGYENDYLGLGAFRVTDLFYPKPQDDKLETTTNGKDGCAIIECDYINEHYLKCQQGNCVHIKKNNVYVYGSVVLDECQTLDLKNNIIPIFNKGKGEYLKHGAGVVLNCTHQYQDKVGNKVESSIKNCECFICGKDFHPAKPVVYVPTVCEGDKVKVEIKNYFTSNEYSLWKGDEKQNDVNVSKQFSFLPEKNAEYKLVVDSAGCSNEAEFEVEVNAKPLVEVSSDPQRVCKGEETEIVYTIARGAKPYTFDGNKGDETQATFTVSRGEGSYTPSVVDANGCVADVEEVYVREYKDLKTVVSVKPTTQTICSGESSNLIASAESYGTDALTYTWSYTKDGGTSVAMAGEKTKSVTPLTDVGEYVYTVTVHDACSNADYPATANVKIYANPSVTIERTSTADCKENLKANVTPATGTYSYYWGDNDATELNTYTGLASGSIKVEVREAHTDLTTTDKYCKAENTYDYSLNPIHTVTMDNVTKCSDAGAVSFSPKAMVGGVEQTSGYTFVWSRTENGTYSETAPSVSSEGKTFTDNIYSEKWYVKAKDGDGCLSWPESATATIQKKPTFDLVRLDSLCATSSTDDATLEIQNAGKTSYSYAWSTGAAGTSITVNSESTYSVTATEVHYATDGTTELAICSTEKSINVSKIEVVAPTLSFTPVCRTEGATATVTFDGEAGYGYTVDNGTLSKTGLKYTVSGIAQSVDKVKVTVSYLTCANSAEQTISFHELPTVDLSVSSDTTCNKNITFTASAMASGAASPTYTYEWIAGTKAVSDFAGATYASDATKSLNAEDNSDKEATWTVRAKQDGTGCLSSNVATKSATIYSIPVLNNIVVPQDACPNPTGGKFEVSVTLANEVAGKTYTYTWTGTEASTTSSANVAKSDKTCGDTYNVSVKAYRNDAPACVSEVKNASFKTESKKPTLAYAIGVDSWSITLVNKNCETLSLTEKIVNDTLGSKYKFTSECFNNTIKNWNFYREATGSEKYAVGTTFTKTTTIYLSASDECGESDRLPVVLNVPSELKFEDKVVGSETTASVTSSPASCNGASDGTITINNVVGGKPTYSYSYKVKDAAGDFTASSSSIENLFANTYTVKVTDANKCSDTINIEVKQPEALNIVSATASKVCYGDKTSVEVVVSGGNTTYTVTLKKSDAVYKMSTQAKAASGNTTITFTDVEAGTYGIELKDDKECGATGTVTVDTYKEFKPGEISSTSQYHCAGEAISVIASVADASKDDALTGATIVYKWQKNGVDIVDSNSATYMPTEAGTYTRYAKVDGGVCPTEFEQSEGEHTLVIYENPVVTIANQDSLCTQTTGDKATIKITNFDDSKYSYKWSTDETTESIDVSVAGEYSVTATEEHKVGTTVLAACSTTVKTTVTEVSVTAPELSFSPVCKYDGATATVTFTGEAGYNYTVDNDLTLSHEDLNYTISSIPQNVNKVTVTASYNSCTNSAEQAISFNELPTVANVDSTAVECGSDGTITISVTGGNTGLDDTTDPKASYTYALNGTTNTNGQFTGLSSGKHKITITDGNGCLVDSTVSVANHSTFNGGVIADYTNSICEYETVPTFGFSTLPVATTGKTITYTWSEITTSGKVELSSGASATTYTPAKVVGTHYYEVDVTDGTTCGSKTHNLTLTIKQKPDVTLESDGNKCGETITFTASTTTSGDATYKWDGDTEFGKDQTKSLPLAEGVTESSAKHTVWIKIDGCVSDASDEVEATVFRAPAITLSPVTICKGNSAEIRYSDLVGKYVLPKPMTDLGTAKKAFSVKPDATTTYTVTVSNGVCTAKDETVTVTVNDKPTITITTPKAICYGEKFVLEDPSIETNGSALTAGSGKWQIKKKIDDDSAWADFDNTVAKEPETYTLRYYVENGCGGNYSDTVHAVVNELPSVSFDAVAPTCETPIPLTPTFGSGDYTYKWFKSETKPALFSDTITITTATNTVSIPSSYTDRKHSETWWVEVTDANSCKNTASVTATIKQKPTFEVDEVTPSCVSSETGEIKIKNIASVGETKYNNGVLTLNNDSKFTTPFAVGTHNITITDANKCSNEITVNVPEYKGFKANPTISGDIVTCKGTEPSERISVSGAESYNNTISYAWYKEGDATKILSETDVLAGNQMDNQNTATYKVKVTDGCTNATKELEAMLTIYPNPSFDFVVPENKCKAENYKIATDIPNADLGKYTYAWASKNTATTFIDDNVSDSTAMLVGGICSGTLSFALTVEDISTLCATTKSSDFVVNSTGIPSFDVVTAVFTAKEGAGGCEYMVVDVIGASNSNIKNESKVCGLNMTFTQDPAVGAIFSGSQTVIITGIDGCGNKAEKTVTVNAPDGMKFANDGNGGVAVTNVTCSDKVDGTITVSVDGVSDYTGYTMTLTSASTSYNEKITSDNKFTGLDAADDYSLVVTYNGCDLEKTGINVKKPKALNITQTNNSKICNDTNAGVITYEITGGWETTYNYSFTGTDKHETPNVDITEQTGTAKFVEADGKATLKISNLYAGTYNLTVYNGSDENCSASLNDIKIEQYDAFDTKSIAAAENNICLDSNPSEIEGEVATGGDGNYTYEWRWVKADDSAADSAAIGSSNSKDLTLPAFTKAGKYIVKRYVKDSKCNTEFTASANAVIYNVYDNPDVKIAGPTMVCLNDGATTVEFSDNTTYTAGTAKSKWSWSLNGTTQSVTAEIFNVSLAELGAGTKSVLLSVTSNKGCTNSTSMEVDFVASPVLSKVEDKTKCNDDKTSATATLETGKVGTAPYVYILKKKNASDEYVEVASSDKTNKTSETSYTFTDLEVGDYEVSVIDANSCGNASSVKTFSVSNYATTTFTAGTLDHSTTDVCLKVANPTVTVSASTTSEDKGVSYQWQRWNAIDSKWENIADKTEASFTSPETAAGVYKYNVVITDQCTKAIVERPYTHTIKQLPEFAITDLGEQCANADGKYTVALSGKITDETLPAYSDPEYTYEWSGENLTFATGNASSSDITVATKCEGKYNYALKITNSKTGCENTEPGSLTISKGTLAFDNSISDADKIIIADDALTGDCNYKVPVITSEKFVNVKKATSSCTLTVSYEIVKKNTDDTYTNVEGEQLANSTENLYVKASTDCDVAYLPITVKKPTTFNWITKMVNGTDVLDADIVNAKCNGASDGEVTLKTVGGTGDITYSLQGKADQTNNAKFTGLSAGTYAVAAVDANGCKLNESVVVGQPDALTATITATKNIVCQNATDGEITISEVSGGNGEYTYWYKNVGDENYTQSSSATIPNLSAGDYTVVVLDKNGSINNDKTCRVEKTVNISTYNAITSGKLANITNCHDDEVRTSFVVVDASANDAGELSYQWYKGEVADANKVGESSASYKPADTEAGEYTYNVVVSNLCESATLTATYTINPNPTFDFVKDANTCKAETYEIKTNIASENINDYTYSWFAKNDITKFDGETTSPVANLKGNKCVNKLEYALTVTNKETGCATTMSSDFVVNSTGTPSFDVKEKKFTATEGAGECMYKVVDVVSGNIKNESSVCGLKLSYEQDIEVDTPFADKQIVTITATDECGNSAEREVTIFAPAKKEINGVETTDVTCLDAEDGTLTVSILDITDYAGYTMQLVSASDINKSYEISNNNKFTGLDEASDYELSVSYNGCEIVYDEQIVIVEPKKLNVELVKNNSPIVFGSASGELTYEITGGWETTCDYVFVKKNDNDEVVKAIGTATFVDGKATLVMPNLEAGIYSLTVFNGENTGCLLSTESVEIEQFSKFDKGSIPTSIESICEGATPSQISGKNAAGGDGIYTYKWEQKYNDGEYAALDCEASSLQLPSDLPVGKYVIKRSVKDGTMSEFDLSGECSFEVFANPSTEINLNGNEIVCLNEDLKTIQIAENSSYAEGSQNKKYEWILDTLTSDAKLFEINLEGLSGTHEVFLTITDNNGCKANSTKQINFVSTPTLNNVFPIIGCVDEPKSVDVDIKSTGDGSYNYILEKKSEEGEYVEVKTSETVSENSYKFTNLKTGEYRAYVSDGNGCGNDSYAQDFVIRDHEKGNFVAGVLSKTETSVCVGSLNPEIEVEGTKAQYPSFQWQKQNENGEWNNIIGEKIEKFASSDSEVGTYHYCVVVKDNCTKESEMFTYTHTIAAHKWNVSWSWNDTESATATFVCENDVKHTKEVNALVSSEITKEATCTEVGEKTYTVKVSFEGNDYSDVKKETIPAIEHKWNEPIFVWDGFESAKATFVCENDDAHKEIETAVVVSEITKDASCTEEGVRIYTATVLFNGKEYSEQRTEVLQRIEHKVVVDPAKNPTCTATGLTEGSHCSVCQAIIIAQEEIPASGHTVVADTAVSPTCTEHGLTAGSHCSVCGEVIAKQDTIKPFGHTVVADTAVSPTCTESGLTAGSHCSVCGVVIEKQDTIKPFGHKEKIDTAVSPTCTESGLTAGSHCSVCGVVIEKQDTIKPFGHTEVADTAVLPTCTESGLTAGSHCSVCGVVIEKQDTIKPFGHTEVADTAVPPTCTEHGLAAGIHCSVCDAIIIAQEEIEPLNHDWEVVEGKDATCEEAGYTSYSRCTRDTSHIEGKTTIPATGHNYIEISGMPATCDKDGYTDYKQCLNDSTHIEGKTILPKLEHNYVEIAGVPATCDKDGYTDYKQCLNDSTHIEGKTTIPATGHNYVEIAGVPATCTEDGYSSYKQCLHDSTHIEGKTIIPKLEHNYVEIAGVPATCDKDGYTPYRQCLHDSTHIEGKTIIPKLEHNYVEIAGVPATCDKDGYTDYKQCLNDSTHIEGKTIIPALEHNYIEIAGMPATCDKDGYTSYKQCLNDSTHIEGKTIIPALEHDWDEIAGVAATCDTDGYTSYRQCKHDSTHIEGKTIIFATGHDWDEIAGIAATCETDGYTSYRQCKHDSTHIEGKTIIPALNHNYIEIAGLPAACDEDGYTSYQQCLNDSTHIEGKTIIPALNHNYIEIAGMPATCDKDGYTSYKQCLNDSTHIEGKTTIPATGHDYVEIAGVPATCDKDGYTPYKQCLNDSTHIEGKTIIPALNHNYIEIAGLPATCDKDGYTPYRQCLHDSTHIEGKTIIPALEHNYVEIAGMPATCDKDGYTSYKQCKHDSTHIEGKTILPKLEHNYIEIAGVPATCEKDGYTPYRQCLNDANHIEGKTTIPATGHNYIEIAGVPATCDKDGYTDYKQCLNDSTHIEGKTIIPALNHNYVEIAGVPATCDKDGYTSYKQCKHDSTHIEGKTILPKLEHNYIEIAGVPATCEKDGYTPYRQCLNDSTHIEGKTIIPKLEHNYVEIAGLPATCDKDGYTAFKQCLNDANHILGKEIISATGHDWEDVEGLEATCFEDGYTPYKRCKNDANHILGKEIISATGHIWEDIAGLAATCTMAGYTPYRRCKKNHNHIEDYEELPATGHYWNEPLFRWSADNSSATATFVCQNDETHKESVEMSVSSEITTAPSCDYAGEMLYTATVEFGGKVYTTIKTVEIEKTGHSRTILITPVTPTCTTEGNTAHVICSVCNAVLEQTRKLPATGHNIVIDKKAKAATCQTDGWTEAHHCTKCDLETVYSEILEGGHIIVVEKEAKEPTCTEGGWTETSHCKRCNLSQTSTELPALGHSIVEIVHAALPTCEADGHTQGLACTRCDYEIPSVVIPGGHQWADDFIPAVAATCEKSGHTAYRYCLNDTSHRENYVFIPAKGHEWELIEWTWLGKETAIANFVCANDFSHTHTEFVEVEVSQSKAATCTEAGEMLYLASVTFDGKTWTDSKVSPLAPLDHNWEMVKGVEPTCDFPGYTDYMRCKNDPAHVKGKQLLMPLGHSLVSIEGIAPTCEDDGVLAHDSCEVCHKYFVNGEEISAKDLILPAIGHEWEHHDAESATCDNPGCTDYYVCKHDRSHTKDKHITQIIPHTLVSIAEVIPTCETDGCIAHDSCTVCHNVYINGELKDYDKDISRPAKGHSEIMVADRPATCTRDGHSPYKECMVCGKITLPADIIPAFGHDSIIDRGYPATCTRVGLSDGSHCAICDEILIPQRPIKMLRHSIVEDIAVEATCTTEGKSHGSHCELCGEVFEEQRITAPFGHKLIVNPADEPTCEEPGHTEGTSCDRCKQVFVPQELIPAFGHQYKNISYLAPTCTESGHTDGTYCEVCGLVGKEPKVLQPLDHQHTSLVNTVVASALGNGYSGDLVCDDCHAVLEYGHEIEYVAPADTTPKGEPVVYVEDEAVFVLNAEGKEISVYDYHGHLIHHSTITTSLYSVHLHLQQAYLVRLDDDYAVRVLVK